MTEQRTGSMPSFHVRDGQPLIGIVLPEDGQEVTHFFTDEAAADAAVSRHRLQAALNVIGAWSDLDWDEAIATLDRIRHESTPTPPIENL